MSEYWCWLEVDAKDGLVIVKVTSYHFKLINIVIVIYENKLLRVVHIELHHTCLF